MRKTYRIFSIFEIENNQNFADTLVVSKLEHVVVAQLVSR